MIHVSKKNITWKIRTHFELNENENASYKNLWDATNAVCRAKYVTLNAYFTKREMSKIGDLRFHIKKF